MNILWLKEIRDVFITLFNGHLYWLRIWCLICTTGVLISP